jgi:hypothetical protein
MGLRFTVEYAVLFQMSECRVSTPESSFPSRRSVHSASKSGTKIEGQVSKAELRGAVERQRENALSAPPEERSNDDRTVICMKYFTVAVEEAAVGPREIVPSSLP